jgi:ribosomal protein L19E
MVREVKGRKTNPGKKKRRSVGNVRKKVNVRKKQYVIMTRKLRRHLAELKKQGKIEPAEVKSLRKKIRNRIFKSKSHLKDYIGGKKYEGTKKKKKRK